MKHAATASWPILPRPVEAALVSEGLATLPSRVELIVGPSGVGKTTLAHAVAEHSGRDIVTVIGLAELSGVPLGAFAPVIARFELPSEAEHAVPGLLRALGREPSRFLLVVDDAPRLDDVSASAVYQLVRAFGTATLMTARLGEELPGPLARLVDEGMVTSRELHGFAIDEVDRLLAARYGRRARHEDVVRIRTRTEGNPLYLRMLVEAAERAGAVHREGGLVRVDDVDAPIGLVEAVTRKLAELGSDDVRTLRLAVLLQPVERAVLATDDAEAASLARLEARGLLVAEPGSQRVRVAHPLIAETLERTALEGSEAAEAARRLRAQGTPHEVFLAIQLELEANGAHDAGALEWAAGYAYGTGDFRRAVALAEHTLASEPTRAQRFSASMTIASARSHLGELDAADRDFATAEALAVEPGELVLLATRRGEHLAYRRFDVEGAFEQALELQGRLKGEHSELLDAYVDQARELMGVVKGMPRLGRLAFRLNTELAIRAAILVMISKSVRGDTAAAREAVAELSRLHAEIGQVEPTASAALGFQRFVELICEGRVAAAAEHLESQRVGASTGVGVYTCLLANLRQCGGELVAAERLASLAVDQLRWRDGMGFLGVALGYQANIAAKLGKVDEARRILDGMSLGQRVAPAAAIPRAEAEAWILAARGDHEGAVEVVERGARRGLKDGYPFLAALATCIMIRLGAVERAAAVLEDICAEVPPSLELCVSIRDLAVALRDRDLEGLPGILTRVHACGQEPTVLDAVALALRMRPSSEVRRKLELIAARAGVRVDESLRQRRETPLITAREWEVARAAARRERSREIAERLGISPRTVESQLQSVYRKLGVGSRDELREALAESGLASTDLSDPSAEPVLS